MGQGRVGKLLSDDFDVLRIPLGGAQQAWGEAKCGRVQNCAVAAPKEQGRGSQVIRLFVLAFAVAMLASGCGPSLSRVGTLDKFGKVAPGRVPILVGEIDGDLVVVRHRYWPDEASSFIELDGQDVFEDARRKLYEFAAGESSDTDCRYHATLKGARYHTEGLITFKRLILLETNVRVSIVCAGSKSQLEVNSTHHTGQVPISTEPHSKIGDLLSTALANSIMKAYLLHQSRNGAGGG